MNELKQEIAELKQEVAELKQEVKEVKQEVKKLKKRLTFTIDATKVEVFVPIREAPEYSISSFGRVRREKPRSDGSEFYPKLWKDSKGYYRVVLNGKKYYLHRLLAEAFIPNPENKPEVDHIDGNKQNNCLSNLRWCTHAENMRNRKKHRNNTSGYTGVTFHKAKGKWQAYISIDGKQKHLGLFHTKEEAAAAYEEAAKEAFGEFFRET